MLEKWLLKHRNFCANFAERMRIEYGAIRQAGTYPAGSSPAVTNPRDIFAPMPGNTTVSQTDTFMAGSNPGDIFASAPTPTGTSPTASSSAASSSTASSSTASSSTGSSATGSNPGDIFAPALTKPPLPASVESFVQLLPAGNSLRNFSTSEHYVGKVYFVDCRYVVFKSSPDTYTILSPDDLSRAGYSSLPAKNEVIEIKRGKKREIQYEKVKEL